MGCEILVFVNVHFSDYLSLTSGGEIRTMVQSADIASRLGFPRWRRVSNLLFVTGRDEQALKAREQGDVLFTCVDEAQVEDHGVFIVAAGAIVHSFHSMHLSMYCLLRYRLVPLVKPVKVTFTCLKVPASNKISLLREIGMC